MKKSSSKITIIQLRNMLSSGDREQQHQAIEILGQRGSVEAIEALAEGLQGEAKFEVAEKLGEIGSPESIAALTDRLKGMAQGAPTETFFNAIVYELARLDRNLVIQTLSQIYEKFPDLPAKNKGVILKALGGLGGPTSLSMLRQTLCDKDAAIVMYAKQAIRKLSDQDLEKVLIGLDKHVFDDIEFVEREIKSRDRLREKNWLIRFVIMLLLAFIYWTSVWIISALEFTSVHECHCGSFAILRAKSIIDVFAMRSGIIVLGTFIICALISLIPPIKERRQLALIVIIVSISIFLALSILTTSAK